MSSNGKRPKLSSDKTIPWVQKKKRFTTRELASHFKAGEQQGAAAVAILRIKGLLTPDGKDPDGVSRWVYKG